MPARGLVLALDYPPAPGGIARSLGWIADTAEIEWLVLTSSPGPSSERVLRTGLVEMPLAAARTARRWLDRRRAEERVVVAAHPYLSGLAVALAITAGARSACIVHGLELIPRRLRHRFALAPMLAADVVVAYSRHSAEILRKHGVRRSRIVVVHPRLRPSWLAAAPAPRAPGAPLRLVALTRLSEGYKNLELLLRLCALLHPLGVVERLTVIGGGPRLDALREKSAALGAGSVELTGHLPEREVGAVLANSHVGLFPSRDSVAERGFEGFGLTVHELAAAGLPVLVGAAAGALDAAEGSWARRLDPDDLWAWVAAVEELYADEPKRLQMARAAVSWASAIDPVDTTSRFTRALLGTGRSGWMTSA